LKETKNPDFFNQKAMDIKYKTMIEFEKPTPPRVWGWVGWLTSLLEGDEGV
jgi:hypothetical protein